MSKVNFSACRPTSFRLARSSLSLLIKPRLWVRKVRYWLLNEKAKSSAIDRTDHLAYLSQPLSGLDIDFLNTPVSATFRLLSYKLPLPSLLVPSQLLLSEIDYHPVNAYISCLCSRHTTLAASSLRLWVTRNIFHLPTRHSIYPSRHHGTHSEI